MACTAYLKTERIFIHNWCSCAHNTNTCESMHRNNGMRFGKEAVYFRFTFYYSEKASTWVELRFHFENRYFVIIHRTHRIVVICWIFARLRICVSAAQLYVPCRIVEAMSLFSHSTAQHSTVVESVFDTTAAAATVSVSFRPFMRSNVFVKWMCGSQI